MGNIIFILLIFIAYFSKFFIKDYISRIVLKYYLYWWAVWLFISNLNPFNLYPVASSIYLLIFINTVMFVLGYLFLRYNIEDSLKLNDEWKKESILKFTNSFKILNVIIMTLLFYYFLKFQQILDPTINLRLERFNVGLIFGNIYELLFYNFFIESYIYILILVTCYCLISNRVKDVHFLIMCLNIFLFSQIGASRGIISDFLISLLFLYIFNKKMPKYNCRTSVVNIKRYINKRKLFNSFSIGILYIILIFYLSVLTSNRLGLNGVTFQNIKIGFREFLNQVVIYYAGPFRSLEYGISNYSDITGYYYGRATMGGVDEIISYLFNILGASYNSANSSIGNILQNNIIYIGDNITFNYAYTNVMIYYFDFGILGVIIIPFLFGLFVKKNIINFLKQPSVPKILLITYLFVVLVNTVFKWGLQSPSSIIVLLTLYLWSIISEKKRRNHLQ